MKLKKKKIYHKKKKNLEKPRWLCDRCGSKIVELDLARGIPLPNKNNWRAESLVAQKQAIKIFYPPPPPLKRVKINKRTDSIACIYVSNVDHQQVAVVPPQQQQQQQQQCNQQQPKTVPNSCAKSAEPPRSKYRQGWQCCQSSTLIYSSSKGQREYRPFRGELVSGARSSGGLACRAPRYAPNNAAVMGACLRVPVLCSRVWVTCYAGPDGGLWRGFDGRRFSGMTNETVALG